MKRRKRTLRTKITRKYHRAVIAELNRRLDGWAAEDRRSRKRLFKVTNLLDGLSKHYRDLATARLVVRFDGKVMLNITISEALNVCAFQTHGELAPPNKLGVSVGIIFSTEALQRHQPMKVKL